MRPSWDDYFLDIAARVATRSTCLRRKVGALIVRDRRILTTGYNGAPRGEDHCIYPTWSSLAYDEDGHFRPNVCTRIGIPSGQQLDLCRGVHAEMNAIIQGAVHGISVDGGTLYCTHSPCKLCAKCLTNAGIVRVVAGEDYPGDEIEAEKK